MALIAAADHIVVEKARFIFFRITEKPGTYRIELCDNPVEGGTTPRYGVINAQNIQQFMEETGAKEYHGSLRRTTANPMTFANPLVLDYGNVYLPDEEALKAILTCMN